MLWSMGMQKRNFLKMYELLQEYDWTGNIRELRNVVERLIILGGTKFPKMM
jgi:transcriptional regulator with AAA-type ATPase domain